MTASASAVQPIAADASRSSQYTAGTGRNHATGIA